MIMSKDRIPKRYFQKYRKEWENMKYFKGWLKPLPEDNRRAYCDACHVVIKAHLCDLKKHSDAKKHKSALRLIRTLQQLKTNKNEDFKATFEEECVLEDDASSNWPREHIELLLKHIKTYWEELQNSFRKKVIWEYIARDLRKDGVNATSSDCRKLFYKMRTKYHYIIRKNSIGEFVNCRIECFDSLQALLESDPRTRRIIEKAKSVEFEASSDEETNTTEEVGYEDEEITWTDEMVYLMLDLLLEFKDVFSGTEGDENEDEVWKNVTEQLQMKGFQVNENHCSIKWQNLISQFNYEKMVVESEGSIALWPYYTRVRYILNNVKLPSRDGRSMRVKLRRGRGYRGRKAQLSEPPEESDAFESDTSRSCKSNGSSRTREEDPQNLMTMQRLTETAPACIKLNSIEKRLEDMSKLFEEHQRRTNFLLTEILNEFSTLGKYISPQPDLLKDDGITVVINISDHFI